MEHKRSLGKIGEDLALDFLKKRGYTIEQRNLKISYKEIDIIATKDQEIIFVEVKTRTKNEYSDVSQVMSSGKMHNFRRAAELFLYFYSSHLSPRLDLIYIVFDTHKKTAKIKHYRSIC